MKSQNKVQAKSLTMGYSFLISIVFALCLIFVNDINVYALTPANDDKNITLPYYVKAIQYYNGQPHDFENWYFDLNEGDYVKANYPIRGAVGSTTVQLHCYNSNNQLIPFKQAIRVSASYTTGFPTWSVQGSIGTQGFSAITLDSVSVYSEFISNRNIYNPDYTVAYTPPPPPAILTFLSPDMGMRDILNDWLFTIQYKFPPNTPKRNHDIILTSSGELPLGDRELLSETYNPVTGIGILKYVWKNVPVGPHIFVADSSDYRTTLNIERVAGIVDSDGDGLDDRTGTSVTLPDYHQYDDNNGTGLTDGIDKFSGFLSSITDFSTRLFSFMPTEVKVVMVFVISVMGFIAIKKFIL